MKFEPTINPKLFLNVSDFESQYSYILNSYKKCVFDRKLARGLGESQVAGKDNSFNFLNLLSSNTAFISITFQIR